MNALEQAISHALNAGGDKTTANKAYLEFIKANFIVPIEKKSASTEPEVLFFQENNHIFMPVFTNQEYCDQWALSIQDQISLLKLSGVNLLKGIEENVSVCLNIGSPIYKEFNPSELARMKNMIIKLFGT